MKEQQAGRKIVSFPPKPARKKVDTGMTEISGLELIANHLSRMTPEALFLQDRVVSCLLSCQILPGRLATWNDSLEEHFLFGLNKKEPDMRSPRCSR